MRSIGVAIPKHLMPHMHDSSTRCLHSRIVKEPIIICGTPKSHHGKQPRGLAEDPGKRTWKGGRYPYCCKDHTRPRRRDLSDRDCVRHRRRRACPDCGAKGVCNKEAILPGIACGIHEDVSVCDADTMELIRKLLPGPITVILKKKPVVPDILTAGSDRVGTRYPDHEITIRLIDLSGTPVTSTSANLPGESPAREVCEISADVLDGADCVIDGGRCEYGVASTVVDLVEMRVLRKGAGYERVVRYLR